MSFGEGPLWNRRDGTLLWVDIVGDTIYRWKPGASAEVSSGLRPKRTAHSRQGRPPLRGGLGFALGVAGRARRQRHYARLALPGKRINSPNDIVVRSDGSIYFTDSPGALYNVGMAAEDLQQYLDFQGVFRISPDGASSTLWSATRSIRTGSLSRPTSQCST